MQTDPAEVESATHGDALESGGSVGNTNKDRTGPLYMHGTNLAATAILTGEQVEVDSSKLDVGALIPTSILAAWVGSRGDVGANGVWQDGKWIVVLMRSLDTGHEDDLVLTPPKAYPVGIAVFDHTDKENHSITKDVITLEWK